MISKVVIPIIIALMIVGCGAEKNELIPENSNNVRKESIMENEEVIMSNLKLVVNGKELDVVLEENSATVELLSKLKNGDVVIHASEYGGFEKVGSLGFSLPTEDKQMTTEAGDIVLYQGNQISVFYDSNSWSYTKIGKIKDISQEELKNILGDGEVTFTFIINQN